MGNVQTTIQQNNDNRGSQFDLNNTNGTRSRRTVIRGEFTALIEQMDDGSEDNGSPIGSHMVTSQNVTNGADPQPTNGTTNTRKRKASAPRKVYYPNASEEDEARPRRRSAEKANKTLREETDSKDSPMNSIRDTIASNKKKPGICQEEDNIRKIVVKLYKQYKKEFDDEKEIMVQKILQRNNEAIEKYRRQREEREAQNLDYIAGVDTSRCILKASPDDRNSIKMERYTTNPKSKQGDTLVEVERYKTIPINYSMEDATLPCPNQTFTIQLPNKLYSVSDQPELQYVPYLGEDKEELVHKLLVEDSAYNTSERQDNINYGSAYEKEETVAKIKVLLRRTTHFLNDAFYPANAPVEDNFVVLGYVFNAITKVFENTNMEEVKKQFAILKQEQLHSQKAGKLTRDKMEEDSENSSTTSEDDSVQIIKVVPGRRINPAEKKAIEAGKVNNATNLLHPDNVASSRLTSPSLNSSHVTSSSVQNGSQNQDDTNHESIYLASVSTLRDVWCRRCFKFDCNLHGIFDKASLQTQYDINIQRERDSNQCANTKYWSKSDELLAKYTMERFKNRRKSDKVTYIPYELKKADNSPTIIESTNGMNDNEDRKSLNETNLNEFQKKILLRVFQIFEGDLKRVSRVIRAPVEAIENYVRKNNPNEFKVPSIVTKLHRPSKQKCKLNYYSVKHYKKQWYEAYSKAVIFPYCYPCVHEGVCTESNCHCIDSKLFCTMACAFGSDSPNFFRGCDCKNNDCTTSGCTCHAANRECDPDLCACTTCSEPKYFTDLPSSKQRCRNDRILMNRALPVLIGVSDASGFGLYNKFPLKEGDYVGEYVGEKISQDEGERRGQIYDADGLSYLFNVGSDTLIDALRKGNKSRYFNHSSTPNLSPRSVFVRGEQRIGFFALCDIEAQSELFFDYKYTQSIRNDLIDKPAIKVAWMNSNKSKSTTRENVGDGDNVREMLKKSKSIK